MIWYDAFTGKQTSVHNPNRHTVRCADVLWEGVQCDLGHGHPGNHHGIVVARDNGERRDMEWENEQ